jgi:hypothetical protein
MEPTDKIRIKDGEVRGNDCVTALKITNSNNSWNLTINPQTQENPLVLPNITHREPDGSETPLPAMIAHIANPCPDLGSGGGSGTGSGGGSGTGQPCDKLTGSVAWPEVYCSDQNNSAQITMDNLEGTPYVLMVVAGSNKTFITDSNGIYIDGLNLTLPSSIIEVGQTNAYVLVFVYENYNAEGTPQYSRMWSELKPLEVVSCSSGTGSCEAFLNIELSILNTAELGNHFVVTLPEGTWSGSIELRPADGGQITDFGFIDITGSWNSGMNHLDSLGRYQLAFSMTNNETGCSYCVTEFNHDGTLGFTNLVTVTNSNNNPCPALPALGSGGGSGTGGGNACLDSITIDIGTTSTPELRVQLPNEGVWSGRVQVQPKEGGTITTMPINSGTGLYAINLLSTSALAAYSVHVELIEDTTGCSYCINLTDFSMIPDAALRAVAIINGSGCPSL